MASDSSKPEEDQTAGLKLVDATSDSGTSTDVPKSPPTTDPTDRWSLPVWQFVVALVLFALVIGWQAQVASELEAELVGLEEQLERTNILLDAHRMRFSEIRGGVHELSERLEGLRALVDSDPTGPPESAGRTP